MKGGAANDSNWGTLRGRIVWGDAQIPQRLPVVINAANPAAANLPQFLEETWIVDANSKGLKNTFVWLAPTDKNGMLSIHPSLRTIPDAHRRVEMNMPMGMFTPHALALREGQILVFRNSSPANHCVKWSGHPDVNPGGNIILLPKLSHEAKDLKADRLPIGVECHVFPWMHAWVRVFDHPYFAVTDEHGAFEFKDAPSGPCRLMIWHGSGGWLGGAKGRNGQPISIHGGKASDLGAIPYPPPSQ